MVAGMRRIEAASTAIEVTSRRCRGWVMSVRKFSTWILTSPCIQGADDPHLPISPYWQLGKVERPAEAAVSAGQRAAVRAGRESRGATG